eukprot:jgi/Phyca11/132888/e_gw1.253.6.1
MRVVRERIKRATHAERLLLEGEFKQYYRMSFAGFERLLTAIGHQLAIDPLQSARRALGEPPVSPAGFLQTCISWLAGGSYHHIRVITGTSRSGFYRIVYAVLRAINECQCLSLGFPLTGEAMKADATAGFAQLEFREVKNMAESQYFCHYQRYGLNVQACADYRCRFTVVACRAPGGRNNSVIFLQWALNRRLWLSSSAPQSSPPARILLFPLCSKYKGVLSRIK